MRSLLIISSLSLALGFSACRKLAPGHSSGNGSGLTDIEFKSLPKERLKEIFGAKAEMLNQIHLLVIPQLATCANATRINDVSPYSEGKIGGKVNANCDYNVYVALAQRVGAEANEANAINELRPAPSLNINVDPADDAAIKPIAERSNALYMNFAAVKITSAQLKAAGAKLAIAVPVKLTKYGADNGFPAEVDLNGNANANPSSDLKVDLASGKFSMTGAVDENYTLQTAQDRDALVAKLAALPVVTQKLTSVDMNAMTIVGGLRLAGNVGEKLTVVSVVDSGTQVVVKMNFEQRDAIVCLPNQANEVVVNVVTIPKTTKPVTFDVTHTESPVCN